MVLERGQKITLIGIGVLFLVTFLVSQYIKIDINENSEYTICKVYDYSSGSNGKFIGYYYYVNEKKYKDSDFLDSNYNPRVGEYYKVKYSRNNPGFSQIIQSERITDSAMIENAGLKLPKRKPRRNQFQEF